MCFLTFLRNKNARFFWLKGAVVGILHWSRNQNGTTLDKWIKSKYISNEHALFLCLKLLQFIFFAPRSDDPFDDFAQFSKPGDEAPASSGTNGYHHQEDEEEEEEEEDLDHIQQVYDDEVRHLLAPIKPLKKAQ